MEKGFKLLAPTHETSIRSITNVRDTAVIVADAAVWIVRPEYGAGFRVERLVWL